MPSNRGRKRNDNLPPNRARDIQRAFRARRVAHLQALEQRVAELQEENEYFRQAMSLPPSSRPKLGRGPTGKDQPYQDDTSRRQTISPSREPSAGSPSSYASSPEVGPSLIGPSISSRTMTVIDAGPPHRTGTMAVNECHTPLSHLPSEQGHGIHAIGQTIPTSPPFETSSSPNYADHVLPPFHSPSNSQKIPRYPPASEWSDESKSRGRRLVRRDAHDEVQHGFYGLSQNYENSERYLHTGSAVYLQSYHDLNHRKWGPSF